MYICSILWPLSGRERPILKFMFAMFMFAGEFTS